MKKDKTIAEMRHCLNETVGVCLELERLQHLMSQGDISKMWEIHKLIQRDEVARGWPGRMGSQSRHKGKGVP